MRRACKSCAFNYWEYALYYIDDILCISHDPGTVVMGLEQSYTLKSGIVKELDVYLGANVGEFHIDGSNDPDKPRWSMSSDEYIKSNITNIEVELENIKCILPKRAITQISPGYQPELDSPKELNPKKISFYQGIIGILR